MNRFSVIGNSDVRMFLTMGTVIIMTMIAPAIWFTVRKRNLDKFVRWFVPVGVCASVVAGIAVTDDASVDKLILIAILGPLSLMSAVGSYPLYRLAKRLLKQAK